MPVDEVLMRDTCGKARPKIKKYFYYNEYHKDNFPFVSDFEELTLLDLLEGTKTLVDIIPLFVPYILIIILALICIGVWICICSCSRKPKCFLKKDNIHTNRTRFICLMVFFGFVLCIIVLGIVILVYISYAENDFNGTICSLLMLQYEIINGQGLLAKNQLYKPYWYGSTAIGNATEDINTLLSDIKTTCDNNIETLTTAYTTALATGMGLEGYLEALYNTYRNQHISVTSADSLNTDTTPIYISNLGPKENNETYTGRVYEGYKNNFEYILNDIMLPVTGLCTIMSQDGGEYLTQGLGGFGSVIDNLNFMLENLSSTITDYITKFSGYIINFGYKVNFSLYTIITASTAIECILYIIYYFRPFSLLKYNIYIFIHIINLTLILCIIYNAVFGILSLLMGNIADIVDAAFSKENLSSQSPRLIDGGTEIKKLARCLRGDGDLFDEFVTTEVKEIVEPLTQLYYLYTPTKTVNEKIMNETGTNEYNSLIAIDEVIKELDAMIDDFILSTTEETAKDNDINTMLDELTKYTMAGRRYQNQCAKATYDIWTTNSNHCPVIQADSNIVTGQCKYLKDYITSPDYTSGATTASQIYNEACSLIDTRKFDTVKNAVYAYVITFSEYKVLNENLINNLLNGEDIEDNHIKGFRELKTEFQNNFINQIKSVMPTINEEITGKVHNLFSGLLNDTTTDSSQLKNSNFSLFSWMNCSAIGQDYNATLSTLKSNLTEEMKVITYCSLVCEFLLIANLYVMVGLSKNLRDKIFEINDERNVSHSSDNIEELQVNSIKETKNYKEDDEIYAIKNKKKFDVDENYDKKLGIDVNEGLDSDGNGITHPAIVSINGPDGTLVYKNGENGENAHNKIQSENNKRNNNNINNKDKETDDNSNIYNNNKLKVKESNKNIEKKNLPKKKLIIDEDKDSDSEEESSRKTKNTKNKLNKTDNKTKSSKTINKDNKSNNNDKKSKGSASSSSVSFG